MPFKTLFRMGAAMLVARPVRLVLCCLICLLAFTILGVADTINAYDRSVALVNSLDAINADYVSLNVKVVGKQSAYEGLTLRQYEFLKSNVKSDRLDKVYGSLGAGVGQIKELDVDVGWGSSVGYSTYAGGAIGIDKDFVSDYGFALYGRLPDNENEVVITEFFYKLFEHFGYTDGDTIDINSRDDMLEKTISFGESSFTVCGILDTGLDTEYFGDYIGGSLPDGAEKSELAEEFSLEMDDGMHNLVYFYPSYLENLQGDSRSLDRVHEDYEGQLSGVEYGSFFVDLDSVFCLSYSRLGDINDGGAVLWNDGEERSKLDGNEAVLHIGSVYFRNMLKERIRYFAEENWEQVRERLLADYSYYADEPDSYYYYILNKKGPQGANEYQPQASYDGFVNELVEDIAAQAQQSFENGADVKFYNLQGELKFDKTLDFVGLAISSELSQISETSLYLSNQAMTELEECLGIVSCDVGCDKVFMPYSADRQAMIKSMGLTKTSHYYSDDATWRFNAGGAAGKMVESADRDMRTLKPLFTWVSVAMVVLSALMILYYASGVVQEKRREIGILRALGAGKRDVAAIFAINNGIFVVTIIALSCLLAAVGAVLANSCIIASYSIAATVIPFGIRQILVLAGVAIIAMVVGIAVPVIRLMRSKPVDIIAGRQ